MKFSIIAGVDDNFGIGKNNDLPWHISADLKHFAAITTGSGNNAVIMGSNTWLSLPEKYRPLKNRFNVVLNNESKMDLPEGVLLFDSLDKALVELEKQSFDEIFIIGGGRLYSSAINHFSCERIYLTKVAGNFACDTFFPSLPEKFKLVEETEEQLENELKFKFVVYQIQ